MTSASSTEHIKNYLALGDSYTIGESVPLHESYPYQTVQLLRKQGMAVHAPEIMAKTGWTTGELIQHIGKTVPLQHYGIVSLLIGVNNQYRQWPLETYSQEFESLLQQSIAFAGGENRHVFVLSIPDWSVTPFAADRDTEMIAGEIDAFNRVNSALSAQYNVHYLDITASTREASMDTTLLAEDRLHPSGSEYAKWADRLAQQIKAVYGASTI